MFHGVERIVEPIELDKSIQFSLVNLKFFRNFIFTNLTFEYECFEYTEDGILVKWKDGKLMNSVDDRRDGNETDIKLESVRYGYQN